MTISLLVLFWIMAMHLLADFVLQTDEMARGKSTSNYWLGRHVSIYSCVMWVAIGVLVPLPMSLFWAIGNGILHWCTDWVTSRCSSHFFQKGDYHNGFIVVGIDQFIHLVCLVLSTALVV